MAIIKIPSSIGGITIPGVTNVPGGPLGVLFGNKKLDNISYPRDLGSATKGHVVSFIAKEITPVNYEESGIVKGFKNAFTSYGQTGAVESAKQAWEGVTQTAGAIGETLGKAAKTVTGGGSLQQAYDVILKERKTKPADIINLYMPETVNFQQNVSYGKTSLVNAVLKAGSLAGTPGRAVSSMASSVLVSESGQANGDSLTKLTLATQGLALNPQDQILFDGIDFRTFQMAFTFTPYSREEARTVKEIIKKFRYHAAPRIQSGTAGMFFIPPSVFEIMFKLNGNENKNINKLAECVITNIDVNYAPNGWAAHTDGAPVQTTLTIQFQEIQLIDRTKIEGGY